jgi:hypothetical protein
VPPARRARPDVDLNTYYVLALNQEANISVIDPLLGFGTSKLLTLVILKSPGEDWELTSDSSSRSKVSTNTRRESRRRSSSARTGGSGPPEPTS